MAQPEAEWRRSGKCCKAAAFAARIAQPPCKRKEGARGAFCNRKRLIFLGGQTAELSAELINPATRTSRALLTSIERMALARDLDLIKRVLFAIGPGNGFPGSNGRPGEDREVRRQILKDHVAVLGVNIFLHDLYLRAAIIRRLANRKAAIIAATPAAGKRCEASIRLLLRVPTLYGGEGWLPGMAAFKSLGPCFGGGSLTQVRVEEWGVDGRL